MIVVLSCWLMGDAQAQNGTRRRRQPRPTVDALPTKSSDGIADVPESTQQPDTTARPEIPADHPLAKALEAAYGSRKALEEVKDYSALFVKRERVKSNPKMIEQMMDLKFRQEPFSVYMRFRKPDAGREVIYVAGANGNRLLVHEEGIKSIAGTIPVALDDPRVKKESRHPITDIGIQNMVNVIIAQWEAETKYGEVQVKSYPNAKLGDTQCEAWVATHPEPRAEFRFHKTVLYLDKETKFPVRVEQYFWPRDGRPAPLIEEYTYYNLKANHQFQNRDFDPRNPSYRFN